MMETMQCFFPGVKIFRGVKTSLLALLSIMYTIRSHAILLRNVSEVVE